MTALERDQSTITFPCKYNTAKLVKNSESSNYCGSSKLASFDHLTAGEGWCGVVASANEFPALRDADSSNQRFKPLWITLIIAGGIAILTGCGCALRAAVNYDFGAPPSEEPASAPGASGEEAAYHTSGISREEAAYHASSISREEAAYHASSIRREEAAYHTAGISREEAASHHASGVSREETNGHRSNQV
jgi:hypothetical protein